MLAYQRRRALLDALRRNGSLTVQETAGQLGVTQVTIRNDLALLARQGHLQRVHGGAVPVSSQAPGADQAMQPDGPDHHMLVARAAAMVEDGESIVITAGRLGTSLARLLKARRQLKVVTNSLEIATILAQESTNTVIIAAGAVAADGFVAIDASVRPALGNLRATRAFITGSHLSATAGLLAESLERAATLRSLAELADSRVLVLEGDGDTGRALVGVLPLQDIDHVILEEYAPPHLVEALRLAGIAVSLCGGTVITIPPRARGLGTYKVAFANLSETEVFTVEVQRSIEEAARRHDTIELLLADNNYDGETALRNAEQFIAQGADLVIEYQIDESYAYRLMHRLRLAGIPVVAIDIPHPGATYFGVDNYVAGHMAGEAIAREVAQRWGGTLDHLFALALPRSGQTVAARLQGQIDAIRETVPLPDEHITWLDSQNTYQIAYQRLREALVDVKVGTRLALIAVNDETMIGAIAALEEVGHAANAVAVSQGADRLALTELLRPGTPLIGAVTFSPETYGERVIALAQDILAGREVPPAVYQQHQLIRPAEAQSYLDSLRALDVDQHGYFDKAVDLPTMRSHAIM